MDKTNSSKGKDKQAKKRYRDEPVSGMDAEKLLGTARIALLQRYFPFFGKVAMGMPLVESERIPTTAVDVKARLYYNRKWVNAFTMEDAIFEVGHEVGHIYQRVFTRRPLGANPMIWNIAADYCVDVSLMEVGVPQSSISKEMVGPKEQKIVADCDGIIEKVYAHILSDLEDEIANSGCKACMQMFGIMQDSQKEEDKAESEDNKSINDEFGEETPGNGGAGEEAGDEQGECNSGSGGCGEGEPLEHTCGNVRACCAGTTADFGEPGGNPSDEQKWKIKLIEAKQWVETNHPGTIPGQMGEQLNGLTKSTVRWQDYLATRATKIFGRDRYSFKRPNRRGLAMGIRMPKAMPDGKSAIMAYDTSGSMHADWIVQSYEEGREIMRQCGAERLYVILHDWEVYFVGEIGPEGFKELKVARGGTSHRDVFKLLNGEAISINGEEFTLPREEQVELAIMFTDLGTDFPSKVPKYDVIWGVPKGSCPGIDTNVPFGTKVEIDIEVKGEK